MKKYLVILVLICSAWDGWAQVDYPKNKRSVLVSKLDSILQNQVNLDLIPGAVIQVKQGRRVIYRHAYGYAQKYNYDHMAMVPPDKMNTRHLFDLASLTKVIGTTTAMMILVDRGKIHLDDPVYQYLPGFDTMDKKNVTIRHLLTHSAGLTEWYPMYYRASNKHQTYSLIEGLPLKYPVGSGRHYSDLGFVLLGEIVELVSGLPLDEFLTREIFIPLHMKKTGFNPLRHIKASKIAATSHGNPYEKRMVHDSTLGFKLNEIDPESWNGWRTYTLRGEVNDGNTWYANGGISGAAGLFSTARDVQKLVDLLMGKSKYPQILSSKTIHTFLTKDQFNNGLGWMMDPANSFIKNGPEGSFGHSGFTGTSISVIPAHDFSIILLINRQNKGLLPTGDYYNVSPVRQQVFQAVLNFLQPRTR